MNVRRGWIEREGEVAVIRQCALAGVARSGVYTRSTEEVVSALDRMLLRLIDAEYTRHPFDGSRRLVVFLKTQGQVVNRKRVQRLIGIMGLAGMAPGPATSKPTLSTRLIPICDAGSTSRARTRCGAPISRPCAWHMASPTWWPSSTGTRAACSPGVCPTPWRRDSAWTVWKRRSVPTAGPRSSIPTGGTVHPRGVHGGAPT